MKTKKFKRVEAYYKAFYLIFLFVSLTSNKITAQNNGIIATKIISDYNEVPGINWKFKTNAPLFASPVVNENFVYVGGVDSILFAIDIKTGIEKWRFHTKGEIRSNVCVNDDQLYLNGGDGNLYAINKTTGNLLWTFSSKGERKYDFADYFHSSPIFKKGIVFFCSGDGNFYAVDSKSGNLIWSFKTGSIVHSTPAIDNDKIFFGSFDGFVYALNSTNGSLIWKFKTVGHLYFPVGEVQGSPAVYKNLVFIGARDYNVYALDKDKGYCHWNKAFTNGWGLSNTVQDSVLFTGTADERVLIASDPETGKELWNVKMEFLVFGNVANSKNNLYLGTTNGKILCFNKLSGRKLWSFEAESYLEKKLKYFQADDSYRDDIYSIIKSNEQFLDVECELGGVFSTPFVSEDFIIFPSTNGILYCLKR